MKTGFLYLAVFALIWIFFTGCAKKDPKSGFIYQKEFPPTAPVILSPSPLGLYVSNSPEIKIVGCFYVDCSENRFDWTLQASGGGSLSVTNTGFEYDATLTANETRTFAFTTYNAAGAASDPTQITITYDSTVELLPLNTLFLGGSSNNQPLATAHYKLNFFTVLPSVVSPESTSNGFVLSGGALNPQ